MRFSSTVQYSTVDMLTISGQHVQMYPLVQLLQSKYLPDIPLPLKNSEKCIQVNNDVLCY